jgi:hypothetical protein
MLPCGFGEALREALRDSSPLSIRAQVRRLLKASLAIISHPTIELAASVARTSATATKQRRSIMRKIALISEHASPLATIGGTDSGGQNVYVAHLARQLARLGLEIDIFTRRDNAAQPQVVDWLPQVRVINVPVGPAP